MIAANSSRALFAIFVLSLALGAQTAPVRYDAGTISGLPARNIGSATMSGRIAAVAAVDQNGQVTVFAGSASRGVWKSSNRAPSLHAGFDQQDLESNPT